MSKFTGTYQQLKDKVSLTGITGEWKELGINNNQKQFRTNTGVILNWWETSKTMQIQGTLGKEREKFEDLLSKSLNNEITQQENMASYSVSTFVPSMNMKKIFIVHGHDDRSLGELELFIRRLKLEPYILKNAGESGKTIIEALEQQIVNESVFGIVLMTPDDVGCNAKEYHADNTKLQARARQNVILEMGILIGAIGRSKVAILRKGNIENPSDVNGLLYISFNESLIKEAGNAIIKHLKSSGISIDDAIITQALS